MTLNGAVLNCVLIDSKCCELAQHVQCFHLKTHHMHKEGNREKLPDFQSAVKSKRKASMLKFLQHCVTYYLLLQCCKFQFITWKLSVAIWFCVSGGSEFSCLLFKVSFVVIVALSCWMQLMCSWQFLKAVFVLFPQA